MKSHKRESETSAVDRIARVAARRVPNAVRAIRLVGNLGVYGLAPEQIEQIRSVLDREMKETMQRLHDGGRVQFNLKESMITKLAKSKTG